MAKLLDTFHPRRTHAGGPSNKRFSNISALAGPSSGLLAILATIANASAADGRAVEATDPVDFLCPSLARRAEQPAQSAPATQDTSSQPRRPTRTRGRLGRRDVPDRYVQGSDGLWHEYPYGASTFPACTPQTAQSSSSVDSDVSSDSVDYNADDDDVDGDSGAVPSGDVSATATSAPTSTVSTTQSLRLPSGWAQKGTSSSVYRVPLIVIASLILACGITALIIGCVLWRKRKRLTSKGGDLEKYKFGRRWKKNDGDDDLTEAEKRMLAQKKVRAKATARWKANARWVYRRGRGKRTMQPLVRDSLEPLPSPTDTITESRAGSFSRVPSPSPSASTLARVDDSEGPSPNADPPPENVEREVPPEPEGDQAPIPAPLRQRRSSLASIDSQSESPGLPPAYRQRTARSSGLFQTPGGSSSAGEMSGDRKCLACWQGTHSAIDAESHHLSRSCATSFNASSGYLRQDEDAAWDGDERDANFGNTAVIGAPTAHVATDDKRALAHLADMASAPPPSPQSPHDASSGSQQRADHRIRVQISVPEWEDEEFEDFEAFTHRSSLDLNRQPADLPTADTHPPGPFLFPPPPLPTSSFSSPLSSYHNSPYLSRYSLEEEEIISLIPEMGPSAPPPFYPTPSTDLHAQVDASAPPLFEFDNMDDADAGRAAASAPPVDYEDLDGIGDTRHATVAVPPSEDGHRSDADVHTPCDSTTT